MARLTLILLCLLSLFSLPALGASSGEGGSQPAVNYVELSPSFVVNVGGPAQRLRYLKAEVTLKVDTQEDVKAVEHHQPAIRNALVFLFSDVSLDQVSTPQGQDELRQEALKKVQTLIKEEEGKEMVTNLLFTSFIVQR